MTSYPIWSTLERKKDQQLWVGVRWRSRIAMRAMVIVVLCSRVTNRSVWNNESSWEERKRAQRSLIRLKSGILLSFHLFTQNYLDYAFRGAGTMDSRSRCDIRCHPTDGQGSSGCRRWLSSILYCLSNLCPRNMIPNPRIQNKYSMLVKSMHLRKRMIRNCLWLPFDDKIKNLLEGKFKCKTYVMPP